MARPRRVVRLSTLPLKGLLADRDGEAPPQQGPRPQQVPGAVVEAGDPPVHHGTHGVGQGAGVQLGVSERAAVPESPLSRVRPPQGAVRDGPAEPRVDEERVAFRAIVQAPAEGAGRAIEREHALDQAGHAVHVERGQHRLRGEACARGPGPVREVSDTRMDVKSIMSVVQFGRSVRPVCNQTFPPESVAGNSESATCPEDLPPGLSIRGVRF